MSWQKQEISTLSIEQNNITINIYTSDSSSNPPNATRVALKITYSDGSTDMKDGLLEEFFSDPTQAAIVKNMLNIVIQEYLSSLGYSNI